MAHLNSRARIASALAMAAACLALPARAQPATGPITRIRTVLEMPRESLLQKPPVLLNAVVTCADKSFGMHFLEDSSGGIYLFTYSSDADLKAGDWVQVEGVARTGNYAPIIDSARVRVLGQTNLPPARHVFLGTLASGTLTGHRVEAEGIIQRARAHRNHVELVLADGANSCQVWLRHAGELPAGWIDARVRVTGVAAVEFKNKSVKGFQIIANSSNDVRVIAPSPRVFESPPVDIDDLWKHEVRNRIGQHRVHIAGVVTLHWPERLLVIQDATGAASIDGGGPEDIEAGDSVSVAGFLGSANEGARLSHAEVRVSGTRPLPEPLPVPIGDAPAHEHRLVRTVGRVVAWQTAVAGEISAILESSNRLFTVILPAIGAARVVEAFPPGSTVGATGVVRLPPGNGSPARKVELWLQSARDLALFQASRRPGLSRALIMASAAAALLSAGLLVLWWHHRRSVAGLAARQRELEEEFKQTEQQLRRSHRERETIAQGLHDNIIQSIYSVGLGLDEAKRNARTDPARMEERLNLAVQTLNGLIREVRNFIGGLEPKGLEGHELRTALKSVLLTSGEDQEARFAIHVDPVAARNLTSAQATEIFNIAKEAMTNSMRHAEAHRTTVSLAPHNDGVRLEVEDDGVGFDPQRVDEGSLGLRSMRGRAQKLGARLDIISSPGHGTRIVVEVPRTFA